MNSGLRRAALMCGAAVLSLHVSAAAAQVAVPNANQYGLNLIGAPTAWAQGYTGNGVTVAVGDTGIATAHTAFTGKIDPRSRNFVLPAPNAAYDPAQILDVDTGGHGTHVAGIVAASGTSTAPGVAYNARLVVMRMTPVCPKDTNCVPDSLVNGAATAAMEYFATLQGVNIYNASYGPTSGKGRTIWPASLIDTTEEAAVERAVTAGKIVVAANGNDREENPVAGLHPNGIALYPFMQPGNLKAGVYEDGGQNLDFSALLRQTGLVIAVNSVGQNKITAPYSQTCGVTASWCVSAPGGNQAQDDGIYSTLPPNTYGFLQGTSMAAPMVSGALAVLQGAYPTYNSRDIANVLFATAENVGGQAGVNATYGYGLIRLDRAVTGPTTLAAGATVNVAAQQVTYWSQPLAAASFTKAGPGALIIAGRTTASGDVTVTGGALGVDGTLNLASRLTVAQGAVLAGFGRINGAVTIAGTLSPGQLPNYADLAANNGGTLPAGIPATGTSPGTLTFQGATTLAATANTRANIDGQLIVPGGPGTWDKIIVTGAGSSFTLGGALQPVLRDIPGGRNNFTPPIGSSFTFITAQDGAVITGQFASIVQNPQGLAPNTRLDVVYNTGTVALNVTPLSFAQQAAAENLNPNQRAVAVALDMARPAPTVRSSGKVDTLYDDLYDDTVAEDDGAMEALSGDGLAASPLAVLDDYRGISDALGARQSQWRDGLTGILPAQASGNWTAWASGFGRWSDNQAGDGLAADSATSTGGVVGADRWVTPELLVGGALGLARSHVSSLTTRTSTQSYAVAAYASWMPGDWVLDGRLAAGPSSHVGTRQMTFINTGTVSGQGDGWAALLAAETGYRFHLDDTAVLQPFAGLTAQRLEADSYQEDTLLGLAFPRQSFNRVTSELGLSASTQFNLGDINLAPALRASWRRDLEDQSRSVEALLLDTPFAIEAAGRGRDAASVQAGLSAWWNDTVSVFAGYSGEFRSSATSHAVTGGVRLHL
ncbi:MAG: autotransporter domain-containing protein [Alphaproteobacteria bacterium]